MKIFILISLTVCALHSNAQIFDITDFGAVGNGSTMNTIAIQSAIDSCHNAGGGIVRAAGGNFLTATVFLKSNVTIQIDSGATITGSPNMPKGNTILVLPEKEHFMVTVYQPIFC